MFDGTVSAYAGPLGIEILRITVGNGCDQGPVRVGLIPENALRPKEPGKGESPVVGWEVVKDGDRSITLRVPVNPDDDFFGLGIQLLSHRQTGRSKQLKTNADPLTDNGYGHWVSPFLVSSSGYGLLFDTHSYASIDTGFSEPGWLTFTVPGAGLDVYLIQADTMMNAVRACNLLLGPPKMPPAWGLGLLYRAHLKADEKGIMEFAESFRNRGVPCDTIGLEPGWQTKSYPCSYVWDPKRFPNPGAMADTLHGKGFKLNLWEHVWVHDEAPFADAIRPLSGDRTGMHGLAPDFTLPEARDLFAGHHAKFIAEGVDGFKLDECDGSDNTGGWFYPDDTRFPSGMTGAGMHNLCGYLYQDVMHGAFAKANKRTLLLCRGNWATDKGNPTVAYSDLYDLKDFVRGMVNSGYSGALWSPEVRDMDDVKDFIRRSQVMFMSHLPQVNAWYNGVAPWDLGEEACSIFREYAELRMSLLPYLYGLWRMYGLEGTPPIRSLALDNPEDWTAREIDDQFMFGDILVAPIVDPGEDKRRVYLPQGSWYDWWTGGLFKGPVWLDVEVPLKRMPMYARSGSVIIRGPVTQHASQDNFRNLTFECWGNGASGTMVYVDDLESLDYARGAYHQRLCEFETAGNGFYFALDAPEGTFSDSLPTAYSLVLKDADEMSVDGMARVHDAAGCEAPCYSYDPAARILRVNLGPCPGSVMVRGRKVVPDSPSRVIPWTVLADRLRSTTGSEAEAVIGVVNDMMGRGLPFTEEVYSGDIARPLGTLLEGMSPDRLRELFPVKVRFSTKNDNMRPSECKAYIDMESDRTNPPLLVRLNVQCNEGWRVLQLPEDFVLQPGHRAVIESGLTTVEGILPANLDLGISVEFTFMGAVWDVSTERQWGGYMTAWVLQPSGATLEPLGNDALIRIPEGATGAECHIWSPVATQSRLELGSGQPVSVRWNGVELGSLEGGGEPVPGQRILEFRMESGWSTLNLEFPEGKGAGCYVRVAGQWGQTLGFLKSATVMG